MTSMTPSIGASNPVWERYRHNFSRHLLGVARYFLNDMMRSLQDQCGHRDLRQGFTPYIALLGEQDRRLTDLATTLGISRQACNQAVKQVEDAGYIMRTADPQDGRAKQLSLSPKGVKLRRDGVLIASQLDRTFSDITGVKALSKAGTALEKIYRTLQLGPRQSPVADDSSVRFGVLLPGFADYISQRLMALTQARGHPGLKLSFGQVLTLIGPTGGRIQQIASLQDVSKQAISAIATELEVLGYLRRENDPLDARQLVLVFTRRGERLITDSVASIEVLEAEFAAIIGHRALNQMKATLNTLYRGLHLEQEVFNNRACTDIAALAQQLQQQLGVRGCAELASLLLDTCDPTR